VVGREKWFFCLEGLCLSGRSDTSWCWSVLRTWRWLVYGLQTARLHAVHWCCQHLFHTARDTYHFANTMRSTVHARLPPSNRPLDNSVQDRITVLRTRQPSLLLGSCITCDNSQWFAAPIVDLLGSGLNSLQYIGRTVVLLTTWRIYCCSTTDPSLPREFRWVRSVQVPCT